MGGAWRRARQSDITANVLTILLPRNILGRDELNPHIQAAQGNEVEQWQ